MVWKIGVCAVLRGGFTASQVSDLVRLTQLFTLALEARLLEAARGAGCVPGQLVHQLARVGDVRGDAHRREAVLDAELIEGERVLPLGVEGARKALLLGQRLLVVVAERQPTGGSELFGIGLPLKKEPSASDMTPVRLRLGGGVEASDHELVPIAPSDGGGALLVRTHAGNTGPLVALQQLRM